MSHQSRSVLFPALVRDQIFDQHVALRRLLVSALDDTTLALRGQPAALARLAESTRELDRRFRAHLAFEEEHLVPILAVVDLWGPERVRALVEEHARQRSELDALVAGVGEAREPEHLAVSLRSALFADHMISVRQA
jgi:hypothetical protein